MKLTMLNSAVPTVARRPWPVARIRRALRAEYLIEAWALGMFMISAGVFTTLIEAPGSQVPQWIVNADVRRMLIGVAMGLTAVALIYSPWGKRSGAHMNPAVTLAFWRLGKVSGAHAIGFIVAQLIGGVIGVLIVKAALGDAFTASPVSYVVTLPGSSGLTSAFIAEFVIAFVLMSAVLHVSNSRFSRYTGVLAGLLVATYITLEAPLSGMSMNPARTFASALPSGEWTAFWIYVVAPVAAMQAAAAIHLQLGNRGCAKLIHADDQPCIHCGYQPSSPLPVAGEVAPQARVRVTQSAAPEDSLTLSLGNCSLRCPTSCVHALVSRNRERGRRTHAASALPSPPLPVAGEVDAKAAGEGSGASP